MSATEVRILRFLADHGAQSLGTITAALWSLPRPVARRTLTERMAHRLTLRGLVASTDGKPWHRDYAITQAGRSWLAAHKEGHHA